MSIRDRIKAALEGLSVKEFLEASGDGRFRLSTPPDEVHWNRQMLLKHPSEEVGAVAALLPEDQAN